MTMRGGAGLKPGGLLPRQILEPSDRDAGVESGPEAEFIPFMAEVVVVFAEWLYPNLFAIALRCNVEGAAHRESEEGEHSSRIA